MDKFLIINEYNQALLDKKLLNTIINYKSKLNLVVIISFSLIFCTIIEPLKYSFYILLFLYTYFTFLNLKEQEKLTYIHFYKEKEMAKLFLIMNIFYRKIFYIHLFAISLIFILNSYLNDSPINLILYSYMLYKITFILYFKIFSKNFYPYYVAFLYGFLDIYKKDENLQEYLSDYYKSLKVKIWKK